MWGCTVKIWRRCEIFDIRQPFGEAIDLNQPNESLLDFSRSFETTMGPARGAVR